MSNFAFLAAEFPEICDNAKRAEAAVSADPRTAAFYARRTVELAVQWAYRNDSGLKFPYEDKISALIHERTFTARAGQAVFTKLKLIIRIGNRAVHETKDIPSSEAASVVRELFHVLFWLARTYARQPPPDSLTFDETQLSKKDDLVRKAFTELTRLKAEMEARDKAFADLLAKATLDAAIQAARAERDAIRRENTARIDTHDYSEAETRDLFMSRHRHAEHRGQGLRRLRALGR